MTRILVAGATGLVGNEVLRLAAGDRAIDEVVALTRRELTDQPTKVAPALVDFHSLESANVNWQADLLVIALGTTIKKAGSKEAFARVDRDYVLAVAQLAKQAGTPACAVVSALGAKPESRTFYPRIKGEVEQSLQQIGFGRLVILRPSFLDGDRLESRPAERLGITAAKLLKPLLPRRWRAIRASKVAAGLLRHGLVGQPGVTVLESERIG